MNNKWHLPSKDVLNAMYENNIGKFVNEYYWSSTGFNSDFAWFQDMGNGYQCISKKKYLTRFRAVRVLPEDHSEKENVFKIDDVEYQAFYTDAPVRLSWKAAKKYCKGNNK